MSIQQDVLQINTTSRIIEVFMTDINGRGVTGLVPANMNIRSWERGKASNNIDQTPIVGSTGLDVYESLKWQEVDATNLPGIYQFSVPDSVWVSSSNLINILFEQPASSPSTLYEVRLTAQSEDLGVGIAPLGLRVVSIETGLNLEQAIRGIAAIVGADTIGADSASITFKGMNDPAVTRAIGEQDEQGNRINTVWTL